MVPGRTDEHMNEIARPTWLVVWIACSFVAIQSVAGQTQSAAATQPATPLQHGQFKTHFTERSPLSTLASQTARFRWTPPGEMIDYDLAQETFIVYVPAGYDPAKAYGLMVWVDPRPEGGWPPRPWQPILDKHKLIWVGANRTGNTRELWARFGLALDAVHNMKQRYNLDPDRIYVAGLSGGGRVASRLGIVYADVFQGALPIVGCDFYKTIAVPDRPNTFWRAKFYRPSSALMRLARTRNRYVLLTGEHDGNRASTRAIYEQGYVKEKFEHVTYIEVPGMGHTWPDADNFDRCIEILDEPLAAMVGARAERNAQAESRAKQALDAAIELIEQDLSRGYWALRAVAKNYDQTDAATQATTLADQIWSDQDQRKQITKTTTSSEARELLSLAKNYLQAEKFELARRQLETIIEHYPDTAQASEARHALEQMPKQ